MQFGQGVFNFLAQGVDLLIMVVHLLMCGDSIATATLIDIDAQATETQATTPGRCILTARIAELDIARMTRYTGLANENGIA